MQQAIDILDEMIKDIEKLYPIDGLLKATSTRGSLESLREAKSRIQALGYGGKVPTITIPEGTVLIGKDEYDSLKEKAIGNGIKPTGSSNLCGSGPINIPQKQFDENLRMSYTTGTHGGASYREYENGKRIYIGGNGGHIGN